MWLRASLLTILMAIVLQAQTPFAAISDPRARAEAVRDARKQLRGRTDPVAMAQWNDVLAEMYLSQDPELKSVVQTLRALNLYDNKSWIDLVNVGYAYTGESEAARQFRTELARRLPDSPWAVQAAIEQWESTHRPRSTTESGFNEWGIARLKFLKSLHEEKPHSTAATYEYVKAALFGASGLPTDEALAVADMALQMEKVLLFDPRVQVAEIYLHRHAHLDAIPGLLDEAVQNVQRSFRDRLVAGENAESANDLMLGVQFQAHCDLAEYWRQKGDIEQARSLARQANSDLARLAPSAEEPPRNRALFGHQQKLAALAKRVGIELGPAAQSKDVDWGKVGRVPLADFAVTDLNGRRWTIRDWRGKVVLVNMWATWCAPCRAELPYIQKLHESFQGRTDRLVISIDVDPDAELARRLVRERGYTFPVISSRQLADQIDFSNGVPQNRIVDTMGRLLVEPAEGSGDAWVSRVKDLMEQVQSSGSIGLP